ncbi:hypothetical protein DKZ56_15180 [Ureibacillus thermophilus]|uniref:Competence protein n=2 Tax=Ureibacillus thermophilus TaxID=367743 RepID=A0A4V1A3F2_9BACL|nr:hypothetical protein DKZ56_15180 [Ureibacillus thermophilus]
MNERTIGGMLMNKIEINEIDVMKNFHVYAIAPFYNEVYSSQILTYDYGKFSLSKDVYHLLDDICIYFGADLNGRLKSARRTLKIRKNPPIIISEEKAMVACQLPYVGHLEPLWVMDLNFDVEPVDKNHCYVVFRNKERFFIKLSLDKVWERRRLALALLSETKYVAGKPSFISL